MRPLISVVVPVYNEAAGLALLRDRLTPVLERVAAGSYEVVYVDDGSDDGSGALLDGFHRGDGRAKVIHLSRNFGHQAALQAGIDVASGEAVALIDCDLQDPPELLEQFAERWRAGFEVVYAVRRRRPDAWWKRASYFGFYRILRLIADVPIPHDAGDFCLLDRSVVRVLRSLPERSRFLRGLRSWAGFRQCAVEYDRDPRSAGASKYTTARLMALALSGYVGFSKMPLRFAALLGLTSAVAGVAMAVGIALAKVWGVASPRGWTSTIAVILVLGGLQLLMAGVLGEYLGRVYDEVRQRPLYIVRSTRGLDEASAAREPARDATRAVDA